MSTEDICARTYTQLPKLAVVASATRQDAPSLPPVHVVPDGSSRTIVSEPTATGAYATAPQSVELWRMKFANTTYGVAVGENGSSNRERGASGGGVDCRGSDGARAVSTAVEVSDGDGECAVGVQGHGCAVGDGRRDVDVGSARRRRGDALDVCADGSTADDADRGREDGVCAHGRGRGEDDDGSESLGEHFAG